MKRLVGLLACAALFGACASNKSAEGQQQSPPPAEQPQPAPAGGTGGAGETQDSTSEVDDVTGEQPSSADPGAPPPVAPGTDEPGIGGAGEEPGTMDEPQAPTMDDDTGIGSTPGETEPDENAASGGTGGSGATGGAGQTGAAEGGGG